MSWPRGPKGPIEPWGYDPWKRALLLIMALGFVLLAFGIGAAIARAEPVESRVWVDPAVENNYDIARRLESQVHSNDEIAVVVRGDWDREFLGDYLNNLYPGKVLIVVIGDGVWVRGNDWVPDVMLDEKLDKIDNVTRRPIDQVVRLIGQIHQWQIQSPRPSPPPPPPPPPGPPPPPPEPFVWQWWHFTLIGGGVLFVIWLPLEIRRRRRVNEIARRADEQADWGFDKYGIKTSLD